MILGKKNVEMQKERAIEKVTMLVHINNNSKKYYQIVKFKIYVDLKCMTTLTKGRSR